MWWQISIRSDKLRAIRFKNFGPYPEIQRTQNALEFKRDLCGQECDKWHCCRRLLRKQFYCTAWCGWKYRAQNLSFSTHWHPRGAQKVDCAQQWGHLVRGPRAAIEFENHWCWRLQPGKNLCGGADQKLCENPLVEPIGVWDSFEISFTLVWALIY